MAGIDTAWLEAQYNNRKRIPEHPRIFEQWRSDSAAVRARRACALDLAYGPGPGETLDVFGAAQANAPVLVFIHGGYWRSLDKSDHSFVADAFADAGAMVVVPNHALCPAVTIEQIALQMVDALAWVFRPAAVHGGDARRIVVAGHSAGGHSAAMLLCCDWPAVAPDLPAGLVRAALAVSGVFELEPLRHTPFLQADLRLTAESAQRLSPVNFAAPRGKLLVTAGALESEEFLRHSRAIRTAWGRRAVPVCETVPGANHLTALHDLADAGGRSHQLALQSLGLSTVVAR
jgi:arylformamidase